MLCQVAWTLYELIIVAAFERVTGASGIDPKNELMAIIILPLSAKTIKVTTFLTEPAMQIQPDMCQTQLLAVGALVSDTLFLAAAIVAPFAVFAIVIHWLERAIQLRLSERFGWNAVLWTGWLGTPIHELSHMVACWIFKHKVVEVRFFEPDKKSGRLGYVEHTWVKGNWFQEFGNVFIGIAPLIGGSIALAALLWWFYPDAAMAAVETSKSLRDGEAETMTVFGQVTSSMWAICAQILSWKHIFLPKFWIFIYLVLCVGSHMAPSRSDYRGASRGALMLLLLVVVLALVLAFLKTDMSLLMTQMVAILSPVFAVFLLTIVLCFTATVIVYFLTMFIPRFFG